LPRHAADYLTARTKATRYGFEAFLLGVGSIIAESFFILAPLVIAANVIARLGEPAAGITFIIYAVLAISPLLILFFANNRRKRIANFQRWREKNKSFLQVMAGLLLIILGIYLFIYKTM
jgi:cytochrome c biogenesis protein CcdA